MIMIYSSAPIRADSEGAVCVCVCGGGGNLTPFNLKISFLVKIWINLEYRIYPKFSHPLRFTLYFTSLQQVQFITYECV